MIFSLIVPTIHRTSELSRLLTSIERQKLRSFSLKDVEIIIVDQNSDDRVARLLSDHAMLTCLHLRAPALGQSNAKNIGIQHARGEYIAFPDDDCFYDPHTLETAYKLHLKLGKRVGLFGMASDYETGSALLRYPSHKRWIKSPKDGSVFLGLQICQFYPKDIVNHVKCFDNELCSGGRWGSGEETDFAIRALQLGYTIQFNPELVVYHPFLNASSMPSAKLQHYGKGFGALCKKHGLTSYFLRKTLKQLAGLLYYLFRLNSSRANTCLNLLKSRLIGYLSYDTSPDSTLTYKLQKADTTRPVCQKDR